MLDQWLISHLPSDFLVPKEFRKALCPLLLFSAALRSAMLIRVWSGLSMQETNYLIEPSRSKSAATRSPRVNFFSRTIFALLRFLFSILYSTRYMKALATANVLINNQTIAKHLPPEVLKALSP